MLKITNASKTFNPGSIDEKRALTNINLHVEKGDFISIIGSNGAGKSTLFNMICGNFLSDTGSIILDGEDITFQPEHIRSKVIGRIFQDPMKGSAPGLTIEENLALAYGKGGWLSVIKKEDREKFREALFRLNMGLEDRLDSKVGLLSGGQRQAVTLMMATIGIPKLLLLDEHTAALDPASADKVIEITNKVVQENKLTCLMVTHNMQMALDLGNRTIMMNDGRIIYDVKGEERSRLQISDLLQRFKETSGAMLDDDKMLLTK